MPKSFFLPVWRRFCQTHDLDVHLNVANVLLEGTAGTGDGDLAGLDGDGNVGGDNEGLDRGDVLHLGLNVENFDVSREREFASVGGETRRQGERGKREMLRYSMENAASAMGLFGVVVVVGSTHEIFVEGWEGCNDGLD